MADDGEKPSYEPPNLHVYRVSGGRWMVPMRPPWRQVPNEDGDIVHVVPTSDLMLHTVREECVCGPTPQLAPGHEDHDHPDIWVHQHHALDGRKLPVLR